MPVKPVTKEEVIKQVLKGHPILEDADIFKIMDSWAALKTAERVGELEKGLETLIKAVRVFQPNINTDDERQMAIYTATHTATQLLNPTGIKQK